jgi:hypothetical protein
VRIVAPVIKLCLYVYAEKLKNLTLIWGFLDMGGVSILRCVERVYGLEVAGGGICSARVHVLLPCFVMELYDKN